MMHRKKNPEFYREWICNITDDELKNYFIFSVVRNPWDRVVSVESKFKVGWKKLLEQCITNGKWTDDVARIHAIPVYDYIYLNGEKFVDYIIRYEQLQHDYNMLCLKLEVSSETLPRIFKSTRKADYRLYYNEQQKELVSRAYADDIKCFGYSFEDYGNISRVNS